MATGHSIEIILEMIRSAHSEAEAAQASASGGLTDLSAAKLYEDIRRRVEADEALDGRHRFLGAAEREQVEILQRELARRGLSFVPIVWPDGPTRKG